MVVFTCNKCGESLKKNAVEKHLFRCPKPPYLTCVDCLKDFEYELLVILVELSLTLILLILS